MYTKIKICGLTSVSDALLLRKYKVDYAGMVLYYPKSKRNISIETAQEIITELKKSDIKTFAVTVSPDKEQLQCIEAAGFDYIQIHGVLKEDVYNDAGISIIRAVNVKDAKAIDTEISGLNNKSKIKGILFDAGTPGSGKTFDWNALNELKLNNPLLKEKMLFLAGGLNKENVAKAIDTVKPDVIDVSSGVEYDLDKKGKSPQKVEEFVNAVNQFR